MAETPAPTPPRPSGRADWRRGDTAATGASNRGPLRAVALIALLGAAGGVVGMMFWFGRSTPPHLITVPGSDYTDPAWPANPWAEQDGKLLRSMVSVFPNSEEAFNFQERDRLVTKLESLKVASGQAVVFHLTTLACTNKGVV
jgi:hypothetical protein